MGVGPEGWGTGRVTSQPGPSQNTKPRSPSAQSCGDGSASVSVLLMWHRG